LKNLAEKGGQEPQTKQKKNRNSSPLIFGGGNRSNNEQGMEELHPIKENVCLWDMLLRNLN